MGNSVQLALVDEYHIAEQKHFGGLVAAGQIDWL